MLPDYEIFLGRGIGAIHFGLPKRELAEILGDPDEIEEPEDERTGWETYCYNSIKCSFSFDPDHEDRLIEIVVENGYFHVGKKIRVGIRKEEALNFGEEFRFGHYTMQNMSNEEFPSRELISFDQVGLHLWLDDGRISVIQILPRMNDLGQVIWPERAGEDL